MTQICLVVASLNDRKRYPGLPGALLNLVTCPSQTAGSLAQPCGSRSRRSYRELCSTFGPPPSGGGQKKMLLWKVIIVYHGLWRAVNTSAKTGARTYPKVRCGRRPTRANRVLV